jgi:phage baseplate assembly protein W
MAFEAKRIDPLDLEPRKAIGVSLPLSGKAVFNSTFQTVDALKANLVNYLLTGRGERYFRPTFGSGLRNLLFENTTNRSLEDIEILIKEALVQYFPTLVITDLALDNQADKNLVVFRLNFKIAGTRIQDQILINIE